MVPSRPVPSRDGLGPAKPSLLHATAAGLAAALPALDAEEQVHRGLIGGGEAVFLELA